MIAKTYMAQDIEWDVSIEDGVDALTQIDADEVSKYLGIPEEEVDSMDIGEFLDLCYKVLSDDPGILYEIYELPTEVVFPTEEFEGIDNPEELNDAMVEYLENTYNFCVNKYRMFVG